MEGQQRGNIIRDHHGRMIVAGVINMGHGSVLLAEATALREGVRKAMVMGYRNLVVEGDNSTVIQSLRGEIESPSTISNMIKDTGKFLSRCGIVSVGHTFREGNRAADWVASAGHGFHNAIEWTASPSRELDSILQADLLGMTLERRTS